MAGIINSAINKQDPFSEVRGYEAERIDIAPEKTVEGRVQGIIDRDPKNIQSEVTRAKQAQNRKGTLNTTMALGAAERARIDTALPIASQDSSQFLQQDLANQAATGRASEFTAGQQNIAGQQERAGQQQIANIEAQSVEDLKKIDYEADIAEGVAVVKAENEIIMENLDADNADRLANIQGKYNVQGNTSAAVANITSAFNSTVNEILSNPKIKPAQKQALIDKATTQYENSLAIQAGISGIDLSGLLDFSGSAGTPAQPTYGPGVSGQGPGGL